MKRLDLFCRRTTVALLMGLQAVAVLSSPSIGQEACGKFKWDISAQRTALTANELMSRRTGDEIEAGKGTKLTLAPLRDVAFALPPERTPKTPDSRAGLVSLRSAKKGRIEIALSDEAWIDVVQNGQRLTSGPFTGEPGCTGIRKAVRFDVDAGEVRIQISDARADSINLLISPVE